LEITDGYNLFLTKHVVGNTQFSCSVNA